MSLDQITDEVVARQTPEAQSIIRLLLAEMAAREERLMARIAELEVQVAALKRTPQNSSLPPSTQPPHDKPPPAKTKSGRKRGGQPGHPKHERTLRPAAECDAVVPVKPRNCRGCGSILKGTDPDPRRHQVWEIPLPQPIVTEYQLHRLTCPCGCSTSAALPEGVPEHTSGPRLTAMAALLRALFRQSKSRAAHALTTCFGVPACPALMVKLQVHATEALAPCDEQLKSALPKTLAANCDETPTKQGPQKAWLWTAAAQLFTVFWISLTRAATAIEGVLGTDYRGVVSADRYGGYNRFQKRQVCWAHLKRDFQALIDGGPDGAVIGQRLMAQLRQVFDHWHHDRGGKITRRSMAALIRFRVQNDVWETLEDGMRSPHARSAALCKNLFDRWDQLWMFLTHAGVEPTNNRAEQVLRHAVIWRKLSFGTQSAAGSRFVETLLTVIETCRQQQRDLLDLLTTALEAQNHHAPAPSLLPAQ